MSDGINASLAYDGGTVDSTMVGVPDAADGLGSDSESYHSDSASDGDPRPRTRKVKPGTWLELRKYFSPQDRQESDSEEVWARRNIRF